MSFREFESLSPNWDRSPANERLGVVFHHSGLGFAETIQLMGREESKVSYHGLIDRDGTRCVLVPDEGVAWHAGASVFRGRARCNDFMMGLAFAGDTLVAALSEQQLASAVEWLSARWVALGWRPDWMTDHRQVAPGRKQDLNPIEWERLSRVIARTFDR